MPKKRQGGFSLVLVVILMVVLAAGVLGGIYYYSQIYQPKQYAKGVISLFDEVTSQFQTTNLQIEGRTTTPAQTLAALKARQELLSQTQNKLVKLSPPQQFRKFHQDFTKAVDYLATIYDDADLLLNFLINLDDLKNKVDLEEVLRVEPKPKTVADANKRISDYFALAKTKSLQVFKTQPQKLRGDEITFVKLQTGWQEIQTSLDVVLKFVGTEDQALPLEALSQLADQRSDVREAVTKIGKFVDDSNALLGLNSPAYIFSSDFITENQPKDINLADLDSFIRDLKQRYPR